MRRKLSQSSALKVRPLWRLALVFAGAAILLLAAIGFRIRSQPGAPRLQSGIAIATPNTHVVGCEPYYQGVRLFHDKGKPSGIPLERRRLSFAGFRASINTRLQGTDTYIVAPWWFVIGCLSTLLTLAGRDVRAGLVRRRRIAGGLCEQCAYDLRATPERCPECGATPHHPPMHRTATASGGAVE
jgi:hypothetical protein